MGNEVLFWLHVEIDTTETGRMLGLNFIIFEVFDAQKADRSQLFINSNIYEVF